MLKRRESFAPVVFLFGLPVHQTGYEKRMIIEHFDLTSFTRYDRRSEHK